MIKRILTAVCFLGMTAGCWGDMITGTQSANGTVSGVTAGAGLSGGGTSGTVTVSVSSVSLSSQTIPGGNLAMGANKITGLANGTAATDAMAYGQLNFYSVLCSSTIAISSSTTSSAFVPSNLGCTATLSNSAHHVLILANITLGNPTSTDPALAGIFRDTTNLDAANLGQCYTLLTIAGFTSFQTNCTLLEYDAPGDTSAHAYRVYFNAFGGGTTTVGNQQTERMIAFEVQ